MSQPATGPNTYSESSAVIYDEIVSALAPAGPFATWIDSSISSPSPVLDVGAGTGILSRALASLGHTVTALDASPAYLEILKRRSPEIETIRDDFRTFRIQERFLAACLSRNTFFSAVSRSDKIDLLQNLRKHLVKDGRIYIDVTDSRVFERISTEIRSYTLPIGVDRSVTVTQEADLDSQEVMTLYMTAGVDGFYNFHETACWASVREIELMAWLADLEVVSIAGSYDGAAYDSGSQIALLVLGPKSLETRSS